MIPPLHRGVDAVPGSCCKGATLATVSNYIGSTKCPAHAGTPINYYEEVSNDKFLSLKNCYDSRFFKRAAMIYVTLTRPLRLLKVYCYDLRDSRTCKMGCYDSLDTLAGFAMNYITLLWWL